MSPVYYCQSRPLTRAEELGLRGTTAAFVERGAAGLQAGAKGCTGRGRRANRARRRARAQHDTTICLATAGVWGVLP